MDGHRVGEEEGGTRVKGPGSLHLTFTIKQTGQSTLNVYYKNKQGSLHLTFTIKTNRAVYT